MAERPAQVVSEARVTFSTLYDERAETCVLRQILGLRFPASDAATHVESFAFRFDQK
jgi:hypothetical protein